MAFSGPFADCRNRMTLIASAPPDGDLIVVAGVNPQTVDRAHRPRRPEFFHQRVLRIIGHR